MLYNKCALTILNYCFSKSCIVLVILNGVGLQSNYPKWNKTSTLKIFILSIPTSVQENTIMSFN